MGPCTDEEKAARRPLMLDSIARITEEAALLDAVFAVESVDVHPLCTPELLREVLDAAADEAHCRVIFDPVNLFCARDGQDRAYQTAHWSRWLESSAISLAPCMSRTAASGPTAARRCCRWARAIWIILPFAPS